MEKNEGPQVEFNTKVVKQGNSLCVRLPNLFAKHMELEEGDFVSIVMKKTDILQIPKAMLELYRKHFKKELKDISDREFAKIMGVIAVEGQLKKDTKDKKKWKEVRAIYLKSAEIQYGKKLLDKYRKMNVVFRDKKNHKKFTEKLLPDMQKIPVWGGMAKEQMEKGKLKAPKVSKTKKKSKK